MIEGSGILRSRPMSPPSERPVEIKLLIDPDSPDLLEGLEIWLQLSLISDWQVRQLSQQHLTCRLPQPIATETAATVAVSPATDAGGELVSVSTGASQSAGSAPAPAGVDRVQSNANRRLAATARQQSDRTLNPIERLLQSLMAELSVVWLLFLGVFLVAISSAVIAASQWQRFTATSQYLVLLGYTVGFWWVSRRTRTKNNLQLTTQALALVALLLIPANFWAMDDLQLWRSPLQWLTVAVAATSLSAIAVSVLARSQQPALKTEQRLLLVNALGLSYLHWGWSLPDFSLIAVYLGAIGTSVITLYRQRWQHWNQQDLIALGPRDRSAITPDSTGPTPPGEQAISQKIRRLGNAIIVYAIAVLLLRAIFIVQVDVTRLGLALGICGWLFTRLSQPQTIRRSQSQSATTAVTAEDRLHPLWQRLGAGLLLLGWLVSFQVSFPWQAVVVSGLGLEFFSRRLRRFWRRADLAVLLVIGLQMFGLVWGLVPATIQTQIIDFSTQLIGAESTPWALPGIVLFPYVGAIAIFSDSLYRQQHPKLATFGEGLALLLGTSLTVVSLVNPILSSLNLILSSLTLSIITYRRFTCSQETRPAKPFLVYLTHSVMLLALASEINRLWPHLAAVNWVSVLLGVVIVEWSISIILNRQALPPRTTRSVVTAPWLWGESSWYIGLFLGLISTYVLLIYLAIELFDSTPDAIVWRLLGLVLPLALTGMASFGPASRRPLAGWLSVGALLVAQLLTLGLPGLRLMGLGSASVLMIVNTRTLRQPLAAKIAVGFGLSFLGCCLGEGFWGLSPLSRPGWFLAIAIAVLALWLLRSWLQRRATPLARIYAQASNVWATFLYGGELFALTRHCIDSYTLTANHTANQGGEYLAASVLLPVAICYRCWQHPGNLVVYLLGWGIGLIAAEAISLGQGTTLELSIATIVLGAVAVLAGEWWQRKQGIKLDSLRILPLLYISLGLLLRLGHFTPWTGCLTLIAAGVSLDLGRRPPRWRPLEYLSFAGVSLGIYELVIYQMLQSSGGHAADGVTILASVAAVLAVFYRVTVPGLERVFRFRRTDIVVIANLHWALGSGLMTFAAIATIPIQPKLAILGISLSVLLVLYALFQGRNCPRLAVASIWVYVGVIEATGIALYARLLWPQLAELTPWAGAIVAAIAYLIYQLPWQSWGWSPKPWQRCALILPLATVVLTSGILHSASLLVVAALYLLLARHQRQIRFTYLSLGLIDWLLWREFYQIDLSDALWYLTPFGLTLLYIAQLDPKLQNRQKRSARHNLRLFGIGSICLPALLLHNAGQTGLLPGVLGLLVLFAGLFLKIRAFLFAGTLTFLGTAFYQLAILSTEHPLFKWAIGFFIGILLIWIAASFETRRSQIRTLVRSWLEELREWE